MNKISFCAAKVPPYFHEDSVIAEKVVNKAVQVIDHSRFDGLIEKTSKELDPAKVSESFNAATAPFAGVEKKVVDVTDAAKVSEAYKAATAPFALPKEVASDAAIDGYNQFSTF